MNIGHRRLQSEKNETDLSIHHTHSHTCWGLEYVYEWQTMDWEYAPHKMVTADIKNSENKFHGYVQSPFVNQSKQTEEKLKTLLKYLNNERNHLSHHEIINIDLEKYVAHSRTDRRHHNIKQYLETYHSVKNTTTTLDPYDVNSCDWKRPVYRTFGDCSRWPIQYYTLGQSKNCWTNDKCSSFSTFSPILNMNLAKGFGFSSIACSVMFVLVLLYWFSCWIYGKICGYNEYDRIEDGGFNYTIKRTNYVDQYQDPLPQNNIYVDDQTVVIQDVAMMDDGCVNEEIIVENDEILDEHEGEVDVIEEVQVDEYIYNDNNQFNDVYTIQ